MVILNIQFSFQGCGKYSSLGEQSGNDLDGSFHGSRAAGTERDQVGHHHVRPVVGRHDHQCPTRDRFQGIKVKQLLFHTPAYDAFPLHFTGNFASDIFQCA